MSESGAPAPLDSAGLLRAIVESSEDAIVSKNLQGIITSWNGAAERMFGYTAPEVIGQSIRIIIPADRQDEETAVLDRIRRGETISHFETTRCRKDGSCLPISLTVSPIRNDGTVIGASKIARDITQQKQAEAAADREHRRAVFLSQMAAALAKSLDFEQTLKSIASLAVPSIADWCAVDIVQDDGEISRLAVTHVDPAKVELARQVRARYENPSAPYSVPQIIRTATPALISDVTDDMIVAAAHGDTERIALVRSLGFKSYICVPLMAPGRVFGA